MSSKRVDFMCDLRLKLWTTPIWEYTQCLTNTTVLSLIITNSKGWLVVWHVKLLAVMLSLHFPVSSSLKAWEKQQKMDHVPGPLPLRRNSWLPASACPNPGCCWHLGNEPADLSLSVSLSLSLRAHNSEFQISSKSLKTKIADSILLNSLSTLGSLMHKTRTQVFGCYRLIISCSSLCFSVPNTVTNVLNRQWLKTGTFCYTFLVRLF